MYGQRTAETSFRWAAMLAWSFNRDGEAKPGLVQDRDEKLGIDTKEKRRERQDW